MSEQTKCLPADQCHSVPALFGPLIALLCCWVWQPGRESSFLPETT